MKLDLQQQQYDGENKKDEHSLSFRKIRENAINTLLTAMENILLDETGMPWKLIGAKLDDFNDHKFKNKSSTSSVIQDDLGMSLSCLSSLKRKCEDENQQNFKSLKVSNSLSLKLARIHLLHNKNTTLDMDVITDNNHNHNYHSDHEDNKLIHEPARLQLLRRIISYHNDNDHESNWCRSSTRTTTNWFELQAIKKNMTIQDFQMQFQQRINDMETSLFVLHNSLPRCYNEILHLTDRFLINADWIRCDYFKPFIQMFPQWSTLGKGFENIVQYVEIVEDMKITVESEFPQLSEDISSNLNQIQEVLEFKRSLYGDVIKQSGLSWKALGFPIDENWSNSTKQWLLGLAFHLELVGSTNTKLLLSSIMLATSYVNLGLSQIDKMENFEKNYLKIIENFASALVETGLKLCEHITRPKTNTITGSENFVYMYSEFVLKFVSRVIEYFGTEKEFEIRMHPLLASLKKK
ncbi:4340_t:CDS:2 [Entrophospora sp. SA101]|nr:4340_t:CDS:2 [Entrophospora sp. SA101]